MAETPSTASPKETHHMYPYSIDSSHCRRAWLGSRSLQQFREPMFEKPLTPSDVGKLNRLVIPKQHAERYFPLSAEANEKGLLLSFEDESGKFWRFRYSYWNSSQSYVLTKGWSRYVKEKQLDAGDVVLFQRDPMEGERLFIGWRKRGNGNDGGGAAEDAQPWSGGALPLNCPTFTRHDSGAAVASQQREFPGFDEESQTNSSGKLRKLRLFGVNMECELEECERTPPGGSSLSDQNTSPLQYYPSACSPNSYSHMARDNFVIASKWKYKM